MDEKDVFNFAGSSLLLRKLRVDMKEDPDTIERLVGNKAAKVGTEDNTGKMSARAMWLLAATRAMVSGSGAATSISSCLKEVKMVQRTEPRKSKPVDRLGRDKVLK